MQPTPPKVPAVQADMHTVCNHSTGQVTSSGSFARDESGRTRIEHGNFATITDPVKGQSFVLDMPKKIAFPSPSQPGIPGMPGMPSMPSAPGVSAPQAPKPPMLEIKDLGQKMINGVMAHGKQYTMPALPGAPAAPGAPKVPGAPSMPGAPKIPGAPSMPGAPGAPQLPTSEVWTSKELQLPVQSSMTNPATGTSCVTDMKNIKPGAKLDPKMFQVPHDFKIAPPPVKPPALPTLPIQK